MSEKLQYIGGTLDGGWCIYYTGMKQKSITNNTNKTYSVYVLEEVEGQKVEGFAY